MTNNTTVIKWINEMQNLLTPKDIVWINGSEQQLDSLKKEACQSKELIKLNEEKLPGCYLHRSKINDVARVEERTFICTETKDEAGPTNNWWKPSEAYDKL